MQQFLNILFLEWPIPDPRSWQLLRRYGTNYETWPQRHAELLETIRRTEKRIVDTVRGDLGNLGAKLIAVLGQASPAQSGCRYRPT